MNKKEISEILPHRNSMLLLDSVEEKEGKALGSFRITGKEWFLDGHFPEYPIVPGVVLCEIMAQSVCVLLKGILRKNTNSIPVFAGMNKVRFLKSVFPGDIFRTECCILKKKHPFYFAEGKGYTDNGLCVKAEFSFKIIEEKNVF